MRGKIIPLRGKSSAAAYRRNARSVKRMNILLLGGRSWARKHGDDDTKKMREILDAIAAKIDDIASAAMIPTGRLMPQGMYDKQDMLHGPTRPGMKSQVQDIVDAVFNVVDIPGPDGSSCLTIPRVVSASVSREIFELARSEILLGKIRLGQCGGSHWAVVSTDEDSSGDHAVRTVKLQEVFLIGQ